MVGFGAVTEQTDKDIVKGAALSGAINATINGGIQWYLLGDHAPLPMTVDGITNDEHTVFGAAVPLAVTLAMILTAIAYKTDKRTKPPFFPTALWLTVKHGFFTLGILVTFAVFWQRLFGSIFVSLPVAVLILAVLAGVVAFMVNYMTARAAFDLTP